MNAFRLGMLLVIIILAGWVFMIFDYFSIRANLPDVEKLKNQYQQQSKTIAEFSEKFKEVRLHFENLKVFHHKLKAMTSLRTDKDTASLEGKKEEQAKELEIASKQGILEVIDSDSAAIDSELLFERETKSKNLVRFFQEEQNPLKRIPNGWPVKGFLIDEFGLRTDPFTGEIRPQHGIDIATRTFHPVYAPADGIVINTKKEEDFGNLLEIDHGNGFVTRYGHLSRFEVAEGDIVRKGKIIAQAGNTGHTTGTRLHYEVIFNEIPQNPLKYIFD